MKAVAALVLFALGTQAWSIDLPVGHFQYTNSQALSTKHFHRLYQRSSKEKVMIEDYRAKGYLCKRQNSSITDCSYPHHFLNKLKV